MTVHPSPAILLVVDMCSFSELTNPAQLAARKRLYDLLATAFAAGGVEWNQCVREDRGDGVLVIVPTDVPKAVVLDSVLTKISEAVEAAPRLDSGWSIRLRMAVHAADIHRDANGFASAELNFVFRLCDAPALRDAMKATERRCAILVSDHLFQTVVRHRYDNLDPSAYHQVTVSVKETSATGWLSIPGDDTAARAVAAKHSEPARRAGAGAGMQVEAGRDITMQGSIMAAGNVNTGVTIGGNNDGPVTVAGRDIVQNIKNFRRNNPKWFAVIVFLLVSVPTAVGGYLAFGETPGASTSQENQDFPGTTASPFSEFPAPTTTQPIAVTTTTPAPTTTTTQATTAGLRDPGILVGSWTSSDNTGVKTFGASGDRCEGFFYNGGQPLDIGGPMYCLLSSQPDSLNRYTLQVTQKPNQATYKVGFDSTDQATVYDGGKVLYRLTRF
jgi:hypothetical protein